MPPNFTEQCGALLQAVPLSFTLSWVSARRSLLPNRTRRVLFGSPTFPSRRGPRGSGGKCGLARGGEVPEHHGSRSQVGLTQRHHRELQRETGRFVYALLDILG
jgi:hypothetical protein